MGLCASSAYDSAVVPDVDPDEKKVDKTVQSFLDERKTSEAKVVKLLLLGTGESGKSTMFKQIQMIYGPGFPTQERLSFVGIVRVNVLQYMHKLLNEYLVKRKLELESEDLKESAEIILRIITPMIDESLDAIRIHVSRLWKNSPGLKKTYENRYIDKFDIADTAGHFFDQIDKITREDYVPTEKDILLCRLTTTGIVELPVEISKKSFLFLDVGGQRNERRKWIHCFEGVTALLYVTAISEFDQMCYEDHKMNRMHESIHVFKQLMDIKSFQKTPIIMFFNKMDIFKEKLKRGLDPSIAFDDYKGGSDEKLACEFIESLYRNEVSKSQDVYVHYTTAVNTENMKFVLNVVKDILLNRDIDRFL